MTPQQIIDELGDSVMYTLHTHTQFCDGRADMEAFAAKASEIGFTHLGFTPHSPITVKSTCNMSKDDVKPYFEEIGRLRAKYPQLRIYRGMEIDYINDDWGPSNQYFKDLGLDYSIGSVHFVPNQEGEYFDIDGRPASFQKCLKAHFDGDVRYVVDKYFEQSQQMLAKGGFEIIGHFDKVKHNAGTVLEGIEDTPWYKRHVDDLIGSIIEKGVIVEINTKSWQEFKHLFPSQRHWKRLLNEGVNIVVNSDAHFPERLNLSRPEVIKSLNYLKSSATL